MPPKEDFPPTYWSNRYQKGQTCWDAGTITPPLKEYLRQVSNPDLRILVPGAGNGHEVEYLHQRGFRQVYLLDFAPEPLQNFRDRVPDFPPNHLLEQDFFRMASNQFDLVLEQTFFCALPRAQRGGYARQMFEILKPAGLLVGVLFSEELPGEGPPFGGNLLEYQAYFEPYFEFLHFAPCYNSLKPRQGREVFLELKRRARPVFLA